MQGGLLLVLAWLVLLAATPCALAAAARNDTDDGDDSAAANARLARDTAAKAAPGGYINERAFLARSLAAVADRGSSSASSSSDGSHGGADDPDADDADADAATAARQQKEADDVHVIEDVLLGIRALPANASAWDLLKAQVAADFAPFLILLPKPLKRFVVAQSRVLFAQFRTFCEGPVSPMVRAGGKIVGVVGSVLEFVGRDLVKLSRAMSSFGLDAARGDDRPEQPAQAEAAQVVEMEAQEGTPSRSGATSPPLQPPPGSASGLDTGAYEAEEEEVEAVEGEEEGELIEI
jgi:hypothetical protein